ncbi:MAG: GNAT family N-acetyltransferase [Aureliella sp.]
MNSVSIVNYTEHEPAIRQIRETVFILEQAVSREDEFDGKDPQCLHALALVRGLPVATGRLDVVNNGKIGRVAVLEEFRRQGFGTQIMRTLESAAKENGLPQVWFHAQLVAVRFYEALGYVAQGDVFEEAGIAHVKMSRLLG